ncbi:unnamed protein product [Ceutorhynchus assimilis]|uniref:Nuclear receptor domain-containing protein n=1 Tax=Ceutorhynchus assimilis TaxID=467358 RepID=A0A9P0GSS5_9CUCU|nr:unnamed protein product [Ceutorhynchus assimilis]
MDYDAAANYAIMNQLCKVCGEPAAGFHFGAFTCEGCKSFFGRTYNNISSISECKNNGKCVINKKNRTACKACRLRKCMMVGMSKSGSRYGRRSNWFKIHCLLQQQQNQSFLQHQNTSDVAGNFSAANMLRPNYLSPLFRSPGAPTPSGARDTPSNCESDSGASSADLDDENRSGSALSYLRPSGSPLSDRVSSDTDCFSKNNKYPLHNNNNHLKIMPNMNSPMRFPHPPSISPASLPSISPNTVVSPSSHTLTPIVPNPRWIPPFPVIGDPAVWREFWLRGQPPIAEPAPDQDQPIDLSVKQCKKSTEVNVEVDEDMGKAESGEGESRVGMPLDLTLAER